MNAFTLFLTQYGLLAIFLLLFTKSIGVPIPIPADLLVLTAAAQAGMGKVGLWQAFGALFLAVVLGGLIQYLLARGPGRGIVHRFGRYLGFTPARLEAASVRVRKGGIPGIGLAMLIPGIRGVAIVAAGLAALPVRSFLAGLVLGSALFLILHFFLGSLAGAALAVLGRIVPLSLAVPVVLALLVGVFVLWKIAASRQKTARQEQDAASVELWHEGVCPACLAAYTAYSASEWLSTNR